MTCKQCGKDFFTKPGRVKKAKFCSRDCFFVDSRRTRIPITCEQCGKEFLVIPSYIKRGSKYCSRACHIKNRIIDAPTRFWSYVEKTETCWDWTGGLTSTGYGQFDKKIKYGHKAHRYSWFLHYGEIPKELNCLHTCVGNRKCVNPKHLYLGTAKNNSEDMVRDKRSTAGERNPSSKLTEKDVFEIRNLRGTKSVTQIAELFNVGRETIRRIINRERWAHIV